MTDSPEKTIALQKIGVTGGMNGSVSCGQCGPDSVHKLGDCEQKEGTHESVNPISGEKESHYKLEFLCPKIKKVIHGAVVWKHDLPGVEA